MKATHQRLMKRLMYITLALSIFALTSCEKENISVIEGYFLDSCSLKPIPPTTLEIWGTYTPRTFYSYKPDEAVGLVTTDGNGYFRFEYDYIKSFDGYKFYSGNSIFYRTGYETRLKFTVIKHTQGAHNIILLTNRPFSNQDTLFLSGGAIGSLTHIVGPFKNMQAIPVRSGFNRAFVEPEKIYTSRLVWGLGTEEFELVRYNPNFQVPPNLVSDIKQYICRQGDNIIIDLRNK